MGIISALLYASGNTLVLKEQCIISVNGVVIQLQILLGFFVVGHLDQGISLRIFLLVYMFKFLLSFQYSHHSYSNSHLNLHPMVEISYICWQNDYLLFELFPNLIYLTG